MTQRLLEWSRPGTAALLSLALAACAGANGTGNEPAPPAGQDGLPPVVGSPNVAPSPSTEEVDGYFVIYRAGATSLSATTLSAGVRVTPLRYVNGAEVRGPVTEAQLRADPNVAKVHLNTIYYTQAATSTPATFATSAPFFQRGWLWGLQQIRANLATTTGTGRRVCIIDSGVDSLHQEMTGKYVAGESFVPTSAAGLDSNGHGSHVAGTVTSNGVQIAAVAPGALIANAKVFAATGGTPVSRVVDAMAWCSRPVADGGAGADVLNMSLGGSRTRGTAGWVSDSTAYSDAAIAARRRGTVVIAAAGNSNTAIPSTATNAAFLPAEATGVVSVGATAPATTLTFPWATPAPGADFDARAGYSNFSTGLESTLGGGIDVWAPGGANISRQQFNVLSICASSRGGACVGGQSYRSISGTSMAAPHAAGVAALIASRNASPRSEARVAAIEACLASTGDALAAGTPFFGAPRINAQRATTLACAGL